MCFRICFCSNHFDFRPERALHREEALGERIGHAFGRPKHCRTDAPLAGRDRFERRRRAACDCDGCNEGDCGKRKRIRHQRRSDDPTGATARNYRTAESRAVPGNDRSYRLEWAPRCEHSVRPRGKVPNRTSPWDVHATATNFRPLPARLNTNRHRRAQELHPGPGHIRHRNPLTDRAQTSATPLSIPDHWQLENFTGTIDVRQLKLPVSAMYWVENQKVQSSLVSTLMLE
jgi:hypothetical protein